MFFNQKPLSRCFRSHSLLLLLWGAAGRRFGPARPLRKETDRSSMEYVRAMAQLFHRVKARRLALESVLRWFDEESEAAPS